MFLTTRQAKLPFPIRIPIPTCCHIMENLFKTFKLILFSQARQFACPTSDAALDLVFVSYHSVQLPFLATHYFLFHLSRIWIADCWPAFVAVHVSPSQQLRQHNCTQVSVAHLHLQLHLCICICICICISVSGSALAFAFIEL